MRTSLCLCIALFAAVTSFAQDEADELPPGLLAEYSTPSHTVRRVDPAIAFVWGAAAPDERLAAESFTAKWSGRVLLRGEGKTRWHAFVQGKVEVRIDDTIVVRGEADKPAWLNGEEFDFGFGEKPFAVTFARTGEAAQLKLFWSSNEFPLEPLPYHILFHEAAPPEIALAARGRVQFEAHRCASCHGGVEGRGLRVEGQTKATSTTASADSQPSLLAPSLKHVGQGTSRAWLVEKVMGSHLRGEEKSAERTEEKTPHPNPLPAKPGRGDKAENPISLDADNRLLWRMNRTRLDAECVRDAVVAVSGRLDLRMGGPSDRQFDLQPGIHVTPKIDYAKFDPSSDLGRRRSIYRFLFRTLPDPFMETLDCPSGDQITPTRTTSVTVQQALALWNDAFIARHCEFIAARIEKEVLSRPTSTDEPVPAINAHIDRAIRLILCRPPTEAESRDLSEYASKHGLANACRLLLNSNEFLFVN